MADEIAQNAISQNVEHHYGPIGRVLDNLSRAFAICAGITLTIMAFMSVASMIGRVVISKPIVGDFEMVQVMTAIVVAMSLPYCQMIRNNIVVDFFTTSLPKRLNDFFDLIANLLLTIGAFTFAWRMTVGMLELKTTGDATMLLNFPTWYAYLPMVLSFFLLGCNALYSAWEDFTGERK
jgi:TRAP-type C4-dicarboxylate transport system permease small subunit